MSPSGSVSFGEGSPGQPVFATNAQPNSVANFRIDPRYFIAFGTYVQGQIVDVNHMTLPAELSFGTGVFSLTATLDSQNLWHITTTVSSLLVE
jgi:rhizosphere induced protein